MSNNEERELKEFRARAVNVVAAYVPNREIVISLKGEPSIDDYDLGILLPVGAVAPLVVGLHAACADMDRSTSDTTVMAQPLNLSGAKVANSVMSEPALVLSPAPFQTHVVITWSYRPVRSPAKSLRRFCRQRIWQTGRRLRRSCLESPKPEEPRCPPSTESRL